MEKAENIKIKNLSRLDINSIDIIPNSSFHECNQDNNIIDSINFEAEGKIISY